MMKDASHPAVKQMQSNIEHPDYAGPAPWMALPNRKQNTTVCVKKL